MSLEINIPAVLAEVEQAFAEYEAALVSNNVETLDRLFWQAPQTVRYGGGENLYGYADIAAFRAEAQRRYLASPQSQGWPAGILDRIAAVR